MDATDFPDDLMQTQAAWNATYSVLAAPRPATPPPYAATCYACPSGSGGTPTGRPPPRYRPHATSCAGRLTLSKPTKPREPALLGGGSVLRESLTMLLRSCSPPLRHVLTQY
ncbi:hypothetical protein GCM10010446_04050 [Streptomyces enissocaesilis]|uniref:Uncharacterized protein n=1 Tax=Streptomyces enissocaesilis TaxID=332589 RepID=A0ABP6J954_9ACTN